MESLLLDNIDQPSDLKNLDKEQVNKLCAEIRQFLLRNISRTGGHLASNLGAVELTVALHRVMRQRMLTGRLRIMREVMRKCPAWVLKFANVLMRSIHWVIQLPPREKVLL